MIAPRYVEDNPNMLRHRDKCYADHKNKLAKIQGKREFETKVQK